MATSKIINQICKDENLAIGDNVLFLRSYIKFLLKDVNTIFDLQYHFSSRIKNHPEILDYAYFTFMDENAHTYEIIIQTDGFYRVYFDNSDVNFDVLFIEFDRDNKLVKKQKIESDHNFGNNKTFYNLDHNGLKVCKNDPSCNWNKVFNITNVREFNPESVIHLDKCGVNPMSDITDMFDADSEYTLTASDERTISERLTNIYSQINSNCNSNTNNLVRN